MGVSLLSKLTDLYLVVDLLNCTFLLAKDVLTSVTITVTLLRGGSLVKIVEAG